jgi:adenylate cyclase
MTAILLALHLGAGALAQLQALEAASLDVRFRLRGPVLPGRETALVLVDDESLAELGRWPLPRRLLAGLVDRLSAAGAKAIVFDLLFAEPGRDGVDEASLREASRALAEDRAPDAARLIDALIAGAAPDRVFADAMERAGNVILAYAFVTGPGHGGETALPEALARSAVTRYRAPPGGLALPLNPTGVLMPVEPLASAAAGLGHTTAVVDPDGTLRHHLPIVAWEGEVFPSLPLSAVAAYTGGDISVEFGRGIAVGDAFTPTDRSTRLLVDHYGPPGTIESHGLADVLAGRVAAEAFTGRIVVVGVSASGIGDLHPSPFGRNLSGAELQATLIDNMLEGRALARPGWLLVVEALAIAAAGLAAFAARRLPVSLTAALAGSLVLLWAVIAQAAFVRAGLWLAVVLPAAAIIADTTALSLWRVVAEERRRRAAERQRANLARYFSPKVAEALAERDRPFSFDRAQQAAVMFVDIVGFTRLCRGLEPGAAIAVLRAFHAAVARSVFAHGGSIDKFLGDGAMAVFGTPEPSPDDAAAALAAAREIASRIAAEGVALPSGEAVRLQIGIGVHWGPVLMGDVGGENRFEFTVIGDTVNVASRLETLTRVKGCAVLASQETVAAAGAEAAAGFVRLADESLPGRDGAVGLWGWSPGGGALSAP